jgi:hypothetical protein
MTRDHQVSQPTPSSCPFPTMMPDIPGSMDSPMHAQHLVSHINLSFFIEDFQQSFHRGKQNSIHINSNK